ncbi:MAG: RNA polymerase sigma factor [Anaerolineales bacterium]|jgi:RNA polymerase sigma-70 factor (ECF subfamily)|nr:RNA polymerase sigma factor [Anaerolineales bacterium]
MELAQIGLIFNPFWLQITTNIMKSPDLNLNILNDEELAHLAKMGKQGAFAQLYDRLLPAVYARVRFKVPELDVEDVTQEVFIAIHKSLHSFRGQSKFSTWIRTITNRKIADYHRSSPANQIEQYDYENIPGDNHNHHLEFTKQEDDLASVQQALMKLPQNYQDILLMRFVDEMAFIEIAHQNKQTLEATKSLFRRSIAALSEKMQEEVLKNE